MESHKPNKDNELESKEYKFQGTGLTALEKRWAKRRFKDYRTHYHIDSLSDLQLLEELVHREVYQEKYHKKIGKLSKDTKSNKIKEETKKETKSEIVPTYIIRSLNENLNQILILKEKLGLFAEKKADDPFQYIQTLIAKHKKWMTENQGSRTLSCPHCKQMIMLKIRTDFWEALKHPFFKDKILTNEHLWKCYKEGKISKLDITKVLLGKEVENTKYIDWLEEKIYRNSD